MHELIHDPFYFVLRKYDRLVVDYCLMESQSLNWGYLSHREAVLYAMDKLREKYSWITIAENKLFGEKISSESLLAHFDDSKLCCSKITDGGKIPYWYAFLEPPHGTGPVIRDGKQIRGRYSGEDFDMVNSALFPKGTDELEVFDWTTDWSNYFDAGHEWWGTACFSVYDGVLDRYVVLMASATD